MNPLNFVAVILKVLLVNLLAVLNFANVFLKIKNVWKIKKNVKNVTKIKKNVKKVFTARCYASAVLAMALCPSVRPSVTSRCSTKTDKRSITQATPHDSPGTLVF